MKSRLCLVVFLLAGAPFSTASTHPDDVEALRQLKSAVDPISIPASSCLASWSFSPDVDPCDSLFSATLFTCGLRCDPTAAAASRVTEITLDPAGYSGTLPSSLWSLASLQILDLQDNRLSGAIPPLPSAPPPLRRLSLSRNQFSSSLPPSLFVSTLEELFLDGNRLTGPLPTTLPDLPNLKRLELQLNNLTGEPPTNMHTALPSLCYLDLSNNAFSGSLPASLPPALVEVAMRDNQIEGSIDPAVGDGLPRLQVLDLSHNRLTGKVPAGLFRHRALQQLVLAGNRLTALEAPGWAAKSELVAVDVSANEVAGPLPGWLAELPRLSAVSLEGNRMTGMIPWAFAAREFSRLLLAGNYLYGPIPSPLLAAAAAEGENKVVSLADNCLIRCPEVFFFCQGGRQKGEEECRSFNPFIP